MKAVTKSIIRHPLIPKLTDWMEVTDSTRKQLMTSGSSLQMAGSREQILSCYQN